MQQINVQVEGWDGDPKIEEYASCETQILVDRGATVHEAILIITNIYEYGTLFSQYEPGDRIKIYQIKYCYKGNDMNVVLHGANIRWTNTIRNALNECLKRMFAIDRLPLKHELP